MSGLDFLRGVRLSFELSCPLAKLLPYIVPCGDAGQLSASVGQGPEPFGVHRGCLFADLALYQHMLVPPGSFILCGVSLPSDFGHRFRAHYGFFLQILVLFRSGCRTACRRQVEPLWNDGRGAAFGYRGLYPGG